MKASELTAVDQVIDAAKNLIRRHLNHVPNLSVDIQDLRDAVEAFERMQPEPEPQSYAARQAAWVAPWEALLPPLDEGDAVHDPYVVFDAFQRWAVKHYPWMSSLDVYQRADLYGLCCELAYRSETFGRTSAPEPVEPAPQPPLQVRDETCSLCDGSGIVKSGMHWEACDEPTCCDAEVPPPSESRSELTCWFVEHRTQDRFAGWWADDTHRAEGEWLTTNPDKAKRFSKAEAAAVAAALSFFPSPFRWSQWVATEHAFFDGTGAVCNVAASESPVMETPEVAVEEAIRRRIEKHPEIIDDIRNRLDEEIVDDTPEPEREATYRAFNGILEFTSWHNSLNDDAKFMQRRGTDRFACITAFGVHRFQGPYVHIGGLRHTMLEFFEKWINPWDGTPCGVRESEAGK